MTDIELEGNELIIHSDGRVRVSPVAKNMDPLMFRHVVAAVDMLYRRNGVLPSEREVIDSWPQFTEKAVQTALASQELKTALSFRGIAWDTKAGLSFEQLTAIQILSDPTDQRTTAAKLKQVGVSMTEYRAWMRNPSFKRNMEQQSEHNLDDAKSMSLNRLIANAEAGDQRAIEKILEITGRWNPQQQELQNAKQVVQLVLEAVEKHASREVLRSILDEVQTKTKLLSLTQIKE